MVERKRKRKEPDQELKDLLIHADTIILNDKPIKVKGKWLREQTSSKKLAS